MSTLFIVTLLIQVARGDEKRHWMKRQEAEAQALAFNKLCDLRSVTLWASISFSIFIMQMDLDDFFKSLRRQSNIVVKNVNFGNRVLRSKS